MSKRKPARRANQRALARMEAATQGAAPIRWSWLGVLVISGIVTALAFIAFHAINSALAWWSEDNSYRSEPEEAVVTSRYYPEDNTGLHVRHYSSCNRFNDCRFSGYEVRFGGQRRSIAGAGLKGAISDYFTLDLYRLLVAVNGIDVYAYDARRTGINGSGFDKVLNRSPNERWVEVSVAEPPLREKPPSVPRYLIAGTRLFEQKTLKQVATVPNFRPVYYDGSNLYFLERSGSLLRLHAMSLPSSPTELLDEMPADCLNDNGAKLLLDAEEVSRFENSNNAVHPVSLRYATVNATRAGLAFQEMSDMPRTSARITFYSLRGADYFDRHKSHCSGIAFKGAASFEQMNKFIDARMQENRRLRKLGAAER